MFNLSNYFSNGENYNVCYAAVLLDCAERIKLIIIIIVTKENKMFKGKPLQYWPQPVI